LEAEERERLAIEHARQTAQAAEPSRTAGRAALSSVPASGRAAAAVQFALAQVGDAYVYGAAGPDAWDCSGLTMGAWAAAGVSLPHSSSAQMGSGMPVSASQLQPGDLVFYYSPVSHVGIYAGDGRVLNASRTGQPVKYSKLDRKRFTVGRRL
jgi:peptidoglycan DL-endopeptidase CwlO